MRPRVYYAARGGLAISAAPCWPCSRSRMSRAANIGAHRTSGLGTPISRLARVQRPDSMAEVQKCPSQGNPASVKPPGSWRPSPCAISIRFLPKRGKNASQLLKESFQPGAGKGAPGLQRLFVLQRPGRLPEFDNRLDKERFIAFPQGLPHLRLNSLPLARRGSMFRPAPTPLFFLSGR